MIVIIYNNYLKQSMKVVVLTQNQQELEDMPRKNIPRKLRQDSDYADLVAKHDHWRAKRLAKILAS